ncbi:MAG: GIY-YIG nuclease family protein [Janthinobacterium lividum]
MHKGGSGRKGGFTDEDDALLEELGVDAEAKPKAGRTAREERIIAGFEDIQRFVAEHGRAPAHGEGLDIFERIYAVRLDRLRALPECRAVLAGLDPDGLLSGESPAEALDDDALLAELGVEADGVQVLRHVRPTEEKQAAERKAAEEIGSRQACADFERFAPMFERVQAELTSGLRETRRFERKSEIALGRWYVLGGQKAFVAAMEEPFTNEHGYLDARLRVVFDNGTESNLLMRSLQRALQKDPAGRRVTEPDAGPLFIGEHEAEDEASGTIYVLRSLSAQPEIKAHREVLHKIGVTGGDVARRIAGAAKDPTFLMAPVEVVATFQLFNINRTRLERLIHRVFEPARLNLALADRFGLEVVPQEWFLVPLPAVTEAIERIKNGTITSYIYDQKQARLMQFS